MARDLFQYVVGETIDGIYHPLEGIRVTVTLADDSPTSIYQADTGSTQGPRPGSGASGGPNPFITGPTGAVEFYANPFASYKITIEDTIAPARISLQSFIWTALTMEDNTLPGVKLIDLSVTTSKLDDLSVTTPKIADLGVTTAKINDLGITTGKLADQAVTTAKINDALKPSQGAAAGTEALRALGTSGSTAAAGNDSRFTKTIRRTVNIAVAGEVRAQSGSNDVIPSFFVAVAAGQTLKLVAVKDMITGGTSATYKIQKNGSDLTGFTGIVATTTPDVTDPADQTLADGDRLQVIVTAISSTPTNLSVSLIFEETF